jgi:hypothetical protein
MFLLAAALLLSLDFTQDTASCHLTRHRHWFKTTSGLRPGIDEIQSIYRPTASHAPHHVVARWLIETINAAG